jgi:predicted dinucleotide-binding enzyme
MRIGVIGSGNIGGTAARLFAAAGHEIGMSHSSGPESLRELVEQLGPRACAMTVEEAADFGQVVLLAVPWRNRLDLPAARLAGKIVVDAMNPYAPDYSIYDLHGSTSSEEVAKALPGARLVKAFNTLFARDLASRGRPDLGFDDRPALLLAGDDIDAKQVVADLIWQIGFAPVDTGSLREGGLLQQPGSELYTRVMTGAEALARTAKPAQGAEQPLA